MEELNLTDKQEAIFKQCLNAVVNGPFIPDWEFSILFGLEKYEVEDILKQWPNVNYNDDVQRGINNTLNNLLGYPIDSPERWSEFISISRKELAEMFKEWKQNAGRTINGDGKSFYFDNLE